MWMLSSHPVLEFWFSEAVIPYHFQKDPAFDQQLKDRFLDLHQEAATGCLDHWQQSASSCLALIIVLDQFSRNLFRGSAQAFAQDEKSRGLTEYACEQGFDVALIPSQRAFLYMPWMHSEQLTDQVLSVTYYRQLGEPISAHYAQAHYDIMKRFGRFPHRNQVLQRRSTLEELIFLQQPGSSF